VGRRLASRVTSSGNVRCEQRDSTGSRSFSTCDRAGDATEVLRRLPALGIRISDSEDTSAYTAGVVGAFVFPLPYRRLELELEAQLGIQYLDVTARRAGVVGTADVSFWSPLAGGRVAMSFALMPMLSVVGGVSVDGSFVRERDQEVRYCAPFCGPPIMETWTIGGAAYGADLGLRLTIR
jgi:hypothetical protein